MTDITYIQNIENNIQEEINNKKTLINNYIAENKLNDINFAKSEILECIIKNKKVIISNAKNYISILRDIWKTMTKENILKTSTYKIKETKETKETTKGYTWCNELNFSYPNKCINHILKEIIKMINVNKYNIKLSIKLETCTIINFKKKFQENINDDLLLTPKKKYITENELNKIDFTFSKIKMCIVKNKEIIISNHTNYNHIFCDILDTMTKEIILEKLCYTKESDKKKEGYYWSSKHKIEWRGKDASSALKEILKIIKINEYSIELSIKLKNDEIINFKK